MEKKEEILSESALLYHYVKTLLQYCNCILRYFMLNLNTIGSNVTKLSIFF